ncbi:hypothetical protein PR202_gb29677 [Eleusine coracana subsp. coracana]|uniref:Uncharacterized protein n=1 Tax=Eleusine coracana subsp. coracana TaxID=191504 RepID=A0AAV5G0I3_ELECO|nr:hypothetical protein QOZ80_6AG0541610 [Eleusine coracana subsp. coracana]GJN40462.1 hypothetical protein PR202_gb29677 [Eleusine coracana subsp. coracana]
MGNCLNPASKRLGSEMMTREEAESLSEVKRISQVLQEEEEETSAQTEGLKVKIVLTRAELEWLMSQLKTGERRLEDVLHHMQAAKQLAADRNGGAWRPRLESIVECQETAYY